MGGGTTGLLVVNTLAADSTSSLDLGSSSMIVRNGDVGSWDGSAYTGITGLVQRAYNFGAWDPPGLTTSAERAAQNAGVLSGTTTLEPADCPSRRFAADVESRHHPCSRGGDGSRAVSRCSSR
jgi:hypothetical protein